MKIDNKKLFKLIKENDGVLSKSFYDEYIDYYKLNDNRIIIFSEVVNTGFVYPDYDYFKNIYKPDAYVNIFENILAYKAMDNDYIQEQLKSLEKKLNIQLFQKYDNKTIIKLSENINKYGKAKIYNSYLEPLFIYLGEVIRVMINGKWNLKLTVTGFVSYLDPIIISEKGHEYKPVYLNKEFRNSNDIDLLYIINESVKDFDM